MTTVFAAPAATDQFMHTAEFRGHFVDFVHMQTFMALGGVTKAWKVVAEEVIDEGVGSGAIMVHGGNDISYKEVKPQTERHKLVTRVIFLLNIMKVGDYACYPAINLVVVDIPEGIESIGEAAFNSCRSLTTVSFPTTLTSIGKYAFFQCSSLDNVDLLHTNLQGIGDEAFWRCSELKSMTIPDSLQTLCRMVFKQSYKLVPSNIDVGDNDTVVAHLRSQQNQNQN